MQESELVEYLDSNLCSTTAEVCEYVQSEFGVEYSVRGVSHIFSLP